MSEAPHFTYFQVIKKIERKKEKAAAEEETSIKRRGKFDVFL